MNSNINFYTGCYSHTVGNMVGNGEGICLGKVNLRTGELSVPECVAPCINPSYLAWGHRRNTLYATCEVDRTDGASLLSYGITENALIPLNSISLQGDWPCHLCIDNSGTFIASAQYSSGDIAVYNLQENGAIGEQHKLIQHKGKGPNTDRQEAPHAHWVGFTENFLAAVDLGTDSVLGYPVDRTTLEVSSTPGFQVSVNGGAGPRHLAALHGADTAYVLCELSEEICQLRLETGGWITVGTIPAFTDKSYSAGAAAAVKVSPDNRHLYASGRNQSVIACFKIDPVNGQLTAIDEIASGGLGPRDFSLSPDGSIVVVANQLANNLVSFKRDAVTGILAATGHSVSTGSPVCVLFQSSVK